MTQNNQSYEKVVRDRKRKTIHPQHHLTTRETLIGPINQPRIKILEVR